MSSSKQSFNFFGENFCLLENVFSLLKFIIMQNKRLYKFRTLYVGLLTKTVKFIKVQKKKHFISSKIASLMFRS